MEEGQLGVLIRCSFGTIQQTPQHTRLKEFVGEGRNILSYDMLRSNGA